MRIVEYQDFKGQKRWSVERYLRILATGFTTREEAEIYKRWANKNKKLLGIKK